MKRAEKVSAKRGPVRRVPPLATGSVSGFWRSARGENHGRDSQPGDIWVEPGDITDTDRLNWMIAHSAYLSHSRDGEVCNVWLSQDPDDDSNGAVPAQGYPQKCYYDAREAIDAAMGARNTQASDAKRSD
jgi:hypothetical protein